MYQRFKACLIQPSKIANYINEPKKNTVIYTIILLIIYIIPLVLISLFGNTYSSSITDIFTDTLASANSVNYVIKDGNLEKTNPTALPECYNLVIGENSSANIFIVFDDTGTAFVDYLTSEQATNFVILFNKDSVDFLRLQKVSKKSYGNVEMVSTNENSEEYSFKAHNFISLTYEKLGYQDVDFSLNSYKNNIEFQIGMATLVDQFIELINPVVIPIYICIIIISGVGMYFSSVLFITLLFKLLYRYLKIDFGIVFKGVILCSTPYVICCLISTLTNFTLLEIVGNIIMIYFATRALTMYKLIYDGGIPTPPYMKHMMGQNDEQNDNEKGSDDDEL